MNKQLFHHLVRHKIIPDTIWISPEPFCCCSLVSLFSKVLILLLKKNFFLVSLIAWYILKALDRGGYQANLSILHPFSSPSLKSWIFSVQPQYPFSARRTLFHFFFPLTLESARAKISTVPFLLYISVTFSPHPRPHKLRHYTSYRRSLSLVCHLPSIHFPAQC